MDPWSLHRQSDYNLFCHKTCFITKNAAIRITLNLVHPTTTYSKFTSRKRYKVPCLSCFQGFRLLLHSLHPSGRLVGLIVRGGFIFVGHVTRGKGGGRRGGAGRNKFLQPEMLSEDSSTAMTRRGWRERRLGEGLTPQGEGEKGQSEEGKVRGTGWGEVRFWNGKMDSWKVTSCEKKTNLVRSSKSSKPSYQIENPKKHI